MGFIMNSFRRLYSVLSCSDYNVFCSICGIKLLMN